MCVECCVIFSKGFIGIGYDGYVFWDIEGFVLLVFIYIVLYVVVDVLWWWVLMLDLVKEWVVEFGLEGVVFFWWIICG